MMIFLVYNVSVAYCSFVSFTVRSEVLTDPRKFLRIFSLLLIRHIVSGYLFSGSQTQFNSTLGFADRFKCTLYMHGFFQASYWPDYSPTFIQVSANNEKGSGVQN